MYVIKKADGSEAIVMGNKPGFSLSRLKAEEMITTENVKPKTADQRRAEAEAAAKAEAEKSGPMGADKKGAHDEKA